MGRFILAIVAKKEKYIEYYPNGEIKEDGTYKDRKMDGLLVF